MRFKRGQLIAILFFCATSCSRIGLNGSSGPRGTGSGSDLSITAPKLKVTRRKLSNGLTLLVSENHALPIYSYVTFFNVGSKFEEKGMGGSSHFLEHLMFKGSKKFGAGSYDLMVEGNGGSNNAYTSRDETVYYQNMPSGTLEKMVELEADRLRNLIIKEPTFRAEKKVILEERKFRYENSAMGQLYYTLLKEIFEGTPYGPSSIGPVQDIVNVTREQVYDYYQTYYVPNGTTIVVVGDVDTDEVVSLVEKHYGDYKYSKKYDEIVAKKDADYLYHHRGRYGRHIRLHGQSPQLSFAMAWKAYPEGHEKSFPLDVLSSMMGSGLSSLLSKEFVTNRKPLLSHIFAENFTMMKNGVFIIGGQLLKGTSFKVVQKKMNRLLKKICESEDLLDQRSLQKTKNSYSLGLYSTLDTNFGLAKFLGSYQSKRGDYKLYLDDLDIYNQIDVPKVKNSCQSLFVAQKPLIASVWDKHPKKRKKRTAKKQSRKRVKR